MKKLFTFFAMLSLLMVFSCGDELDIKVFDTPPSVMLDGPAGFVEQGDNIEITVTLQDGASEELSTTPLASVTASVRDSDSTEVFSETKSISGREATVAFTIPANFDLGTHWIIAQGTDTGGNSAHAMIEVEVIEKLTIGIIGSATTGGWDTDTDLIRSEGNPDEWTLEMTLSDGEAKFRANDSWTRNWGDDSFPTGVGVQDGPNIPVVGGTYKITFNSDTGEYEFLEI